MRRVIVAAVATAALMLPQAAAAASTWSWLAYGGDQQLTNDVPSSPIIPANVARTKLAWSAQLDGAVVASPVSTRVTIGDRLVQVVYAATEAGSVYAISVDTGDVLWQRTFGAMTSASCGPWGFSSTGVIDTRRNVLYEAVPDGSIHALDLATGDERGPWPVQFLERPRVEYVWGGLQLIGDRLFVPVASYCDAPDELGVAAEGRLSAFDPDTAQVVANFDPVEGPGNLGGIWGWGGISAEPDGTALYTAVGNSYVVSDGCACIVDDVGYGDRVVALGNDLSVLASNKPREVPGHGDEDFGAAPLVFQPRGCPPLIAAKNKIGVVFVWKRHDVEAGPIAALGVGDGTSAFVGAPSYDDSRQLLVVSQAVVPNTGDGYGVAAFRTGPACTFAEAWRTAYGTGNQAPVLVVGDLVFAAGGSSGGFAALNLLDGKQAWSYDTAAPTISPLMHVAGTVIGGDFDGNLYAFRVPGAAPQRVRGLTRRAV